MGIEPHGEPGPDEVSVILDSIAEGVFTVDKDFHITSFNRAAQEITGIPREEALGTPCWEVFRADMCENDCAVREAQRSGGPVVNRRVFILRSDGSRLPISVSSSVLRDGDGRVVGGVESFRDLTLVEELKKKVEQGYSFQDIISRNKKMRRIFSLLPEIAKSASTVLIEGPSGTGKELLARAIHNISPRKDAKMVAVNCGAIPATLLESELFGHVKGAFTGADSDRPGRLDAARGGTLFLDEIAEIPPPVQVKLLRVLQEKTYEPLGSNDSSKADVRVVVATNRDLKREIADGRFREDLYYRVNVIRLKLPPLAERKDDIPLLAGHFIDRQNRLQARDVSGLSHASLDAFMAYDWPGNIRELENAIEHAFILCKWAFIEPEHLPDAVADAVSGKASRSSTRPAGGNTLAECEAAAIYDALVRNNWNRTAAAAELGIGKTTLWRKMKKYEIMD